MFHFNLEINVIDILSWITAFILGILGYKGIIRQIKEAQNSYYTNLLFEMYKIFHSKDILFHRSIVASIPFEEIRDINDKERIFNRNLYWYHSVDTLLNFFETLGILFIDIEQDQKTEQIKELFAYYIVGYWNLTENYINIINKSREKSDFFFCNFKKLYESVKNNVPFNKNVDLQRFILEERYIIESLKKQREVFNE